MVRHVQDAQMPASGPPDPPQAVIPLTPDEVELVKAAVLRVYGPDAIIRNYGSDPARIALHVEADHERGMELYDMLGLLMTRIDRAIDIEVTRRGTRVHGKAKIAYRQGIML